VAVMLAGAGSAEAETVFLEETYDSGWTPAEWNTDRYAPAGFEAVDFDSGSRLKLSIAGADRQTNDFYNTQGMKRGSELPVWTIQSVSVDLYVGSDWDTGNRAVGLWAQMLDVDGIESSWPKLCFRHTDAPIGDWPKIDAGLYVYNYIDGGWMPGSHAIGEGGFGQWYNIEMRLTRDVGFEFFVNDTLIETIADELPWSHHITAILLDAYNFGGDYDVHFDNLTAAATPEPATMALLVLGGVSVLVRRRRGK
jgi:hypothetical protein